MKTKQEIIKEAKKLNSYTNALARNKKNISESKIDEIVKECKNWNHKENEGDSYSPFDKLARYLGRSRR